MKLRQMDSAILVQLVLLEKLLKEFDNLVPRLRHSLPLYLIHHIPPRLQSASPTIDKPQIHDPYPEKHETYSTIPSSPKSPSPIPLRIRKPHIPLRTNEKRRIFDILKVRREVNVISRMGDCDRCNLQSYPQHPMPTHEIRPNSTTVTQNEWGSTPIAPLEEIPGRFDCLNGLHDQWMLKSTIIFDE